MPSKRKNQARNVFEARALAPSQSLPDNAGRPLANGDGLFPRTLWTMADFDFSTKQIVFTLHCRRPTSAAPESRGRQLELQSGRGKRPQRRPVVGGGSASKNSRSRSKPSPRRATAGGGAADDCQLSYAHAFLRDPVEVGGTTLESHRPGADQPAGRVNGDASIARSGGLRSGPGAERCGRRAGVRLPPRSTGDERWSVRRLRS